MSKPSPAEGDTSDETTPARTHTHTFSHVLINTNTSPVGEHTEHNVTRFMGSPAASYQLSANPPLAEVPWPVCFKSWGGIKLLTL